MCGISYHVTVLEDTYFNIKPKIKLPRMTNRWSGATWEKMGKRRESSERTYIYTPSTQFVDQKSESLAQFLDAPVSKHVPHKVSSSGRNIPQMTRPLCRMCQKKQKLYDKAENKRTPHSWREFLSYQQHTPASSWGSKRAEILNKKNFSLHQWRIGCSLGNYTGRTKHCADWPDHCQRGQRGEDAV